VNAAVDKEYKTVNAAADKWLEDMIP